MADSWTLGWATADNDSPVTGWAKRNVLTAHAGGMDRIIDEVAPRAAKYAAKNMLARITGGNIAIEQPLPKRQSGRRARGVTPARGRKVGSVRNRQKA